MRFASRACLLAALALAGAPGCGTDDYPVAPPSSGAGPGATAGGAVGGTTGGIPEPRCGDGFPDPGEACDDLNHNEISEVDQCSADCTVAMILYAQEERSTVWQAQFLSGGALQFGVLCVPTFGVAPHAVLAVNHDGFAGFGGEDPVVLCQQLDDLPYARAYAQFRGQPDPPTDEFGFPVDHGVASAGAVEVCLGEVNDAAALVRGAQRLPDIAKDAVYAAGVGHGGCVSLQLAARATQLGLPPLRAVAALAAPTDFTALYPYLLGTLDPDPMQYDLLSRLDAAGGPPSADPARYAARNILEQAGPLVASRTPVLLMHGTDDPVVPLSQACALHTRMRALGADAVDAQLDAQGNAVPGPLAEPTCADVELAATAPPVLDQPYYFMPLQGVDHSFTPDMLDAFFESAVEFVDLHPDAP